jgi:hypothetical protein
MAFVWILLFGIVLFYRARFVYLRYLHGRGETKRREEKRREEKRKAAGRTKGPTISNPEQGKGRLEFILLLLLFLLCLLETYNLLSTFPSDSGSGGRRAECGVWERARGNERKRNASHPCLFYARFISIDLGKGKCFLFVFIRAGRRARKEQIRLDGMGCGYGTCILCLPCLPMDLSN